jgi:hypothetical protein
MSSTKTYHRPYSEPEPRSSAQWSKDLGIECEGNCPDANIMLTYDEFCFLPEVRLKKVRDTELYGWWREYGDVWGECRTVKEWLNDFNWELVEPTDSELRDLNLFIGHDEFWSWSSGKVTDKANEHTALLSTLRKLFTKK